VAARTAEEGGPDGVAPRVAGVGVEAAPAGTNEGVSPELVARGVADPGVSALDEAAGHEPTAGLDDAARCAPEGRDDAGAAEAGVVEAAACEPDGLMGLPNAENGSALGSPRAGETPPGGEMPAGGEMPDGDEPRGAGVASAGVAPEMVLVGFGADSSSSARAASWRGPTRSLRVLRKSSSAAPRSRPL